MLNYTRLIGGRVPSPTESLANYGSAFAEQMPSGQICGTPAQAGCTRPDLNVTGWFRGANAITGPVTGSNVYAIRDVVSTTRGHHTLYYGGEANRENDAQQTTLNNYGVFGFTTRPSTTMPRIRSISARHGELPVTARRTPWGQDVPVYANANYFNYGIFFQDDWRALPSLTLNLGIRYDIQTTPTDTLRRTMNFVPNAVSSVAPGGYKGVLFHMAIPARPCGRRRHTRYNHISPSRVGLAWTPYPNGHTVIHAAAGLFYGSIGGNLFTYPSNGEPFSGRPSFSNVIHVNNPYATDPKDFCNGDPVCIAGGVGHSPYPFIYNPKNPQYVVTPAAIIPVDPNFHWPVSYQFNLGFEQQLGAGFAFSGSYVGALSRKLPTEWDVNYPTFNVTSAGTSGPTCTDTTLACSYANAAGTVNNRRPFNAKAYGATSTASASNPILSSISQIQSSEGANYHGLQITIQKRLTKGFSAQGFYVWSKALQSMDLDTTGNTGNSTGTEPGGQQLPLPRQTAFRLRPASRHGRVARLEAALQLRPPVRSCHCERLDHHLDHSSSEWPAVQHHHRLRQQWRRCDERSSQPDSGPHPCISKEQRKLALSNGRSVGRPDAVLRCRSRSAQQRSSLPAAGRGSSELRRYRPSERAGCSWPSQRRRLDLP